jgi:hypothetical protein
MSKESITVLIYNHHEFLDFIYYKLFTQASGQFWDALQSVTKHFKIQEKQYKRQPVIWVAEVQKTTYSMRKNWFLGEEQRTRKLNIIDPVPFLFMIW